MSSVADLRDDPDPTYDRAEPVYRVREYLGAWEVAGPAFTASPLRFPDKAAAEAASRALHRAYWHGRTHGSNERARQVLSALGIAPQYGDDTPLKFRPRGEP